MIVMVGRALPAAASRPSAALLARALAAATLLLVVACSSSCSCSSTSLLRESAPSRLVRHWITEPSSQWSLLSRCQHLEMLRSTRRSTCCACSHGSESNGRLASRVVLLGTVAITLSTAPCRRASHRACRPNGRWDHPLLHALVALPESGCVGAAFARVAHASARRDRGCRRRRCWTGR